MRTRRKPLAVMAALALCLFGTTALLGDQAHCPVIVAGTRVYSNNTVQLVGQGVIGRSNNGTVFAHHGVIGCYQVEITCLLGDVNGDGLIDGEDVHHYVRVHITGVGTPRELCAADLTPLAFATLLVDE